jgi:uncharacterized protein (DUF488 family)
VLEQTISSVRELEQSIEGRALADLRVRLALRGCLSELRGLVVGDESRCLADVASLSGAQVVRICG